MEAMEAMEAYDGGGGKGGGRGGGEDEYGGWVRWRQQVSVPSTNMLTIVTVRCGLCAYLLSVNMGALLQSVPLQDLQKQQSSSLEDASKESGSSSTCNKFGSFESADHEPPTMPPICR
ncbi:hypothetical protein TEA_025697 [Camellia sinensis var. sinensis]|uniref:YABBY N-terminal domain-containing protein n=1 Tax=Camellia sinensis var. sinensis TaxID=542762 RepID=A0A4S4DMX0_CAMSN|nr:hypothetical protein TEA_025697 [Camellia sinensis var. sinensis]